MVAELKVQESELQSADGTRLAYRGWKVPEATVSLGVIHGLGEHSARYAGLAAAMAEYGIATSALDLRGHGRSPGQRGHVDRWSQWLEDAAAFIDMLAREQPGEVVPLGHSFGGAIVLSAVLRGRLSPARFAVSNPALATVQKPPGWQLKLASGVSRMAPRLSINNQVDARVLSRDPSVVAAYVEDPLVHPKITARAFFEWVAAANELQARAGELRTPFLMILGEQDRLIDPAISRELFERAASAGKVLKVYPGRFHEPFNDLDSEEVFGDLAAWLKPS